MTYKIGKTNKIVDTIELTDSNGNVVKTLDIKFDIDAAAKDMIRQYEKVIGVNKSLHELLSRGKKVEYSELAKVYADEVALLFKMAFGIENTIQIMEFYEGNCIEMVQQLVPYIFGRLLPKIKESVKVQKKSLKKAFK